MNYKSPRLVDTRLTTGHYRSKWSFFKQFNTNHLALLSVILLFVLYMYNRYQNQQIINAYKARQRAKVMAQRAIDARNSLGNSQRQAFGDSPYLTQNTNAVNYMNSYPGMQTDSFSSHWSPY